MPRRSDREREERPAEERVKVAFSPVNEQVVIAACIVDAEARRRLTQSLRPESFLVEEHRPIWAALMDLERQGLAFDWATLEQLAGGRANLKYLRELAGQRAEAPSGENLHHHVQAMGWDRRKAIAVQGPLNSLIEALQDPAHPPERVSALARHVAESLQGSGKSFTRERGELVASMVAEIRKRREGHACYPYGVDGLDFYEEGYVDDRGRELGGRHRLIPGARPGQVTVLTAVSSGGKSTLAAHIALGLGRQGRRVYYGAWEPGGDMTMELLACISLGISRSDVSEGLISDEQIEQIRERAEAIGEYVTMMENPFQRAVAGKESNARNLDLVQQHIVESGCEVFIADLWERCLVDDDPSEEKRALFRMQAMAKDLGVHMILLAQQRMKDIETRADKRPTREGIKGSSAWVEVADTVLATHRPYLFKKVDDDRLEVIVWKQRWGKWPLVVEFDWDADFASIARGRSAPFEHIGEEGGDFDFKKPEGTGGKKRPRRA
jgi:replicative DNA helicase